MLSPELGWTESIQEGAWDTGHKSMTRNTLANSQGRRVLGELCLSLAAVRLACSGHAVVVGEGDVWTHRLLGWRGKRDYAGVQRRCRLGVRAGSGAPRHC